MSITPGTVTDEALLDERQETLVAAIARDGERFGLAWLDLAAGRFTVSQADGRLALAAELERLKPAELLICEGSGKRDAHPHGHGGPNPPAVVFEFASASRLLTDQMGTLDLKGLAPTSCRSPSARRAPLAVCSRHAEGRPYRTSAACTSRNAATR